MIQMICSVSITDLVEVCGDCAHPDIQSMRERVIIAHVQVILLLLLFAYLTGPWQHDVKQAATNFYQDCNADKTGGNKLEAHISVLDSLGHPVSDERQNCMLLGMHTARLAPGLNRPKFKVNRPKISTKISTKINVSTTDCSGVDPWKSLKGP